MERIPETLVRALVSGAITGRANVVGYSCEYHVRIRAGQEVPGSRVLRVYLSRKLPKDQLRPQDIIPATFWGCETDCVVIVEVVAAAYLPVLSPPSLWTGRHQVLVSGISLGHGAITAGTLGCFVVQDGHDLMLTNWHVGKGEAGKVGDMVYQPGPYDIQNIYGEGPGPQYAAGILASFSALQEGVVDAALVRPTREYNPDRFISPQRRALGIAARLSAPVEPVVGLAVLKEGRTTGVTRGTIIDTEATLSVNYGEALGNITFSRCLVIEGKPGAYLAGGDSGSVTREDSGTPEQQAAVGLNFAGTTGGYGIANRMSLVAQALGFEFAPVVPIPSPPVVYASSNLVEVHFQVVEEVATRLSFLVDKSVYNPAESVDISGRLVEEVTGQPIAGVGIGVDLDGGHLNFTTGPDGAISGVINGLAPGDYILKAQFVPLSSRYV